MERPTRVARASASNRRQPVGGGSVELELDEHDDEHDEQSGVPQDVTAHGLALQLWTLHELDDVQQPVQQLPQKVPPEHPSTLVVEQFEHAGWPHDCTWHECTLHDCALQPC